VSDEQAAAVDELRAVLESFAAALELVRESGLSIVDGFRAAGVEVPSWVPAGMLENLLATS